MFSSGISVSADELHQSGDHSDMSANLADVFVSIGKLVQFLFVNLDPVINLFFFFQYVNSINVFVVYLI